VSYQVFARKYRPQTFDDVVGQDHVTTTLRNAIERNRIAHAYLFVGPRGTGKTSTARIIAKALNCESGPTPTPCGTCSNCEQITQGRSLDVLEIDGASNNGVEQVRELRENVRMAPASSRFKIYIIDEVHMLSSAAFNALLKTLEEPPEHVKFIFATTEVQKVLPTILSRCQRFDLRRIPANLIARHLEFIAGKEKLRLTPAAAEAITKGAEGGLRDAESMLDQLVAFCGDEIDEKDVLTVFGFSSPRIVADLCARILDRDTAAALGMVRAEAEAGRDLLRLLADLLGHFRNLLVLQADPGSVRDEIAPELQEILAAQAAEADPERLLELIDLFATAEGRMKWAPNKGLQLEIAVIKAIQMLGQATLTDVLDTLSALRDGRPAPAAGSPAPRSTPREPARAAVTPSRPSPARPAAPAPEAAERADKTPPASFAPAPEPVEAPPAPAAPPAPPGELDAAGVWKATVAATRGVSPFLHSALQAAALISLREGVCRIALPASKKLDAESLAAGSKKQAVEEALSRYAGEPVRLEVELSHDPSEGVDGSPTAPPPDPVEEFKNDPLIKQALELFKAEIKSVQ
jgi:DNA polymerase-3 subunit gamma/tau